MPWEERSLMDVRLQDVPAGLVRGRGVPPLPGEPEAIIRSGSQYHGR